MAIVFTGKSKCPLCGEVLVTGSDTISLPPIRQTGHALFAFFDCGIHRECFDNWEGKEEALALVFQEKEAFKHSRYYRDMLRKYGPPGSGKK